MLHEFLTTHHDELVNRCRAKVGKRAVPQATATELLHGVPLFLDQLIDTLRAELGHPRDSASQLPRQLGASAGKHGNELLLQGFTVDQVVHDYGDLCQAVTELAAEMDAPITVDEFRTFNRCLDNAIADAVTEFGRERDVLKSAEGTRAMNERLGMLAHELRNLLNSAILAFHAIQTGNVAVGGATGGVLERSLFALRDVIDRSLADVRLTAGLPVQREPVQVAEFVQEVALAAALEATRRGIQFRAPPVDKTFVVDTDRQMLGSALSNLLQNAFKFTRRNGQVSLSVREEGDHILIAVEDECGGLPDDTIAQLFRPFEQRSSDRSGVGLGLSISRRAVEANGGTLQVRSLPGKGCVFTIDLLRSPN